MNMSYYEQVIMGIEMKQIQILIRENIFVNIYIRYSRQQLCVYYN